MIMIFSFLFSPPFFKAILKTAELSSLRNVLSSIYRLFVPHYLHDDKNYNFLNCDCFKKLLFPTNSFAKLLSDSLLSDSLLSGSLLSDS